MLHKFCKNSQKMEKCGGKDEFELKKKEWKNVTIDLREVKYGETCTYRVKSKCGYPQIMVNNSDVDMIVTYKKERWQNGTQENGSHDRFEKGEAWNPKCNKKEHDGKAVFHMPKKDKIDKNDKECQQTEMTVTITNLKNTAVKSFVSRSLQQDTS